MNCCTRASWSGWPCSPACCSDTPAGLFALALALALARHLFDARPTEALVCATADVGNRRVMGVWGDVLGHLLPPSTPLLQAQKAAWLGHPEIFVNPPQPLPDSSIVLDWRISGSSGSMTRRVRPCGCSNQNRHRTVHSQPGFGLPIQALPQGRCLRHAGQHCLTRRVTRERSPPV